jgi:hypothetical protein
VTCQEARTQAELPQTFADLPAPHPSLPGLPGPSADIDDDIPPLAMSICAALLLGMPVAVVLGFVYGAWWTLAVPVTLSVAMLYADRAVLPYGAATSFARSAATSKDAFGYRGSMSANASLRSVATAQLRYHLRSAGTTYHIAAVVLHRFTASS